MRSRFGTLLSLVCAAALFAACGPTRPPESSKPVVEPSERASVDSAPKTSQAPIFTPEEVERVTHVAVLDRETLSRVEGAGFGLGQLIVGSPLQSTADLDRDPSFHSMFQVLREDLADTKRRFPLARPTSVDGFRQFDARWLASDEMHFELVGVFNRLDRRAFYVGTCGEIRFVFRLAYETRQGGQPMVGRLPLTVNAVFLVAPSGSDRECVDAARSWQRPKSDTEDSFQWLLHEGPLGAVERERWSLKSVEFNLQTIRLQSTVHTSLAGHIEYAMHVFHPSQNGASFLEAPMENMPDVKLLRTEDALREALLEFLTEEKTLSAIDRGTLQVPERFLARRAISFSPRGLTRRANRPFRQLFDEADFAELDLSRYRTIRSPKALLRRLDGASCTGCHQSRTIAGFHHVGIPATEGAVGPHLFSGSSAHLEADLERRRGYVAKLARGDAVDEFRPVPERQGAGRGFGSPCGLGDPGFEDWSCEAGFSCQRLEDDEVGVCLPTRGVGSPCEHGTMVPGKSARRDRVTGMTRHACGDALTCDRNIQGFPLGACGGSCDALGPGSVCGSFLDVDGYQNCLRGKLPNRKCADKYVFDTGLRACDATRRCRQDYVCVRANGEGVGACVPPYFVYALRNDGYPLPR